MWPMCLGLFPRPFQLSTTMWTAKAMYRGTAETAHIERGYVRSTSILKISIVCLRLCVCVCVCVYVCDV